MPHRILYISPGTGLGGGEMSLLTLIKNLDRNRYEPVVCAYGEGPFIKRIRRLGCASRILSYGGFMSQGAFIVRLAAFMKNSGADLIHVNTLDIRAGIAARLAMRPLIGHLRVIFPTTWVDRLFVRLAQCVVSVSDAARDHFCQTQGISIDPFETIYNAVDISDQKEAVQQGLRAELGLDTNATLIGAVGRIDPWKGLETFVDAAGLLAKTHPDMHYAIAGSPGPAAEEQNYARQLRERVNALDLERVFHFLGFRADALDVIRQFDVLTVPSRILHTPQGIKTEGFGRVAAEGLAMRTPVVASRVGGLPEIIADGRTGCLFEESNAAALARAVEYLLAYPKRREAMVEAGFKKFHEEFSVARHLERIQMLYARFI